MTTLRNVAELASVSIATASRVLNGSGSNHPVSEEVRNAVQTAANTLNYMPSAPARALKTQRSNVIGVIASDILDPYFAEMARGVEIEAARHGFVTILANANRDPLQERTKFRVLREHQASGIVFCGSDIDGAPGTAQLTDDVNVAMKQGTQVVTLAPRSFEATPIVIDNAATSYELTQYLLDRGHRDIAFLGGLPGLVAIEERIRGFGAALHGAGVEGRPAARVGLSQMAGRKAMEDLVAANSIPDAVICANDEVAVGVLAASWAAGLRTPKDVSVAGIGGAQAGAVFGLTTMVLPLMEQGMKAAEFIARGRDEVGTVVVPAVHLRVGGTTR